MNLTAKQLIENYSNLLATCYKEGKSNETIVKLFNSANHLALEKMSLKDNNDVFFFLGSDGTALYAIIVSSATVPTAATIDALKPMILKFSDNEYVAPKGLNEKFNANNTIISYQAYLNRINSWKKDRSTWLNAAITEKNIVKYFIIKKQNISAATTNTCVFGLVPTASSLKIKNSLTIDLLITNEAYMDYSTPIPPFN